jgi:hypothetical protein
VDAGRGGAEDAPVPLERAAAARRQRARQRRRRDAADTTADPNKNNLNAEIYYPPYLFAAGGARAARPTIATAPAWVDIGKTYTLDVTGAASVSRVTWSRPARCRHSFNFDQRFLELTFKATGNRVAIQAPTRAADATPATTCSSSSTRPACRRSRRSFAWASPPTRPIDHAGTEQPRCADDGDRQQRGAEPQRKRPEWRRAELQRSRPAARHGGRWRNGRISGSPTTAGSYNVVVSATDGVNTATASFVLDGAGLAPLALATPPAPTFIAVGGTAHVHRQRDRRRRTALPMELRRWQRIDRVVEFADSKLYLCRGGSYVVTVSVSDDSGAVVSRSFVQAVYLPTTAKSPSVSGNLLVEKPPAAMHACGW